RHQLPRQREVALRARGLDVVQHDRLAETRRLRQPYVARDGGAVDAVAEVLLRLVRDLAREVQPLVEHRQQHTVYLQARIDVTLNETHRVQELRQPFQRVELALDRDQHGVRRGERVQRQQAERGRAVHQDEVVLVAHGLERAAQHQLALGTVDQLDLRADQVAARGRDVEEREVEAADEDLLERQSLDHDVVHGRVHVRALDADPAGRVALGVHVDDERAPLGDGQAGTQIDGGRGLADAALLVRYGNDAGHALQLWSSLDWGVQQYNALVRARK